MERTEQAQALQQLLAQPVLLDAPLSRYTTWRIGGPADLLLSPATEDELAAVLRWLNEQQLPWQVIGNGSNLLVSDQGVRGAVIRMGEAFSGCTWRDYAAEALSGTLLAALAGEAGERGAAGLEFARGIPGSVGGGVRMNAGAYGHNLGELVTYCCGVGFDGRRVRIEREQLSFAYRQSSLFDVPAVVTRVGFALRPGDKQAIQEQMRELLQRRSAAQPLEYPSCGSVFRNPEGSHAGYLVEQAGLRGISVGPMQVSEKHGNFIINRGGGTAAQARQLIALVQERVKAFSGYELHPEVRFVGAFD